MTVMSFPKVIQVLRDSGGKARRAEWTESEYLSLGVVPWNGEQEALLHHRPADGRRKESPDQITIFTPFGSDVRALDWAVEAATRHALQAAGPGGASSQHKEREADELRDTDAPAEGGKGD